VFTDRSSSRSSRDVAPPTPCVTPHGESRACVKTDPLVLLLHPLWKSCQSWPKGERFFFLQ